MESETIHTSYGGVNRSIRILLKINEDTKTKGPNTRTSFGRFTQDGQPGFRLRLVNKLSTRTLNDVEKSKWITEWKSNNPGETQPPAPPSIDRTLTNIEFGALTLSADNKVMKGEFDKVDLSDQPYMSLKVKRTIESLTNDDEEYPDYAIMECMIARRTTNAPLCMSFRLSCMNAIFASRANAVFDYNTMNRKSRINWSKIKLSMYSWFAVLSDAGEVVSISSNFGLKDLKDLQDRSGKLLYHNLLKLEEMSAQIQQASKEETIAFRENFQKDQKDRNKIENNEPTTEADERAYDRIRQRYEQADRTFHERVNEVTREVLKKKNNVPNSLLDRILAPRPPAREQAARTSSPLQEQQEQQDPSVRQQREREELQKSLAQTRAKLSAAESKLTEREEQLKQVVTQRDEFQASAAKYAEEKNLARRNENLLKDQLRVAQELKPKLDEALRNVAEKNQEIFVMRDKVTKADAARDAAVQNMEIRQNEIDAKEAQLNYFKDRVSNEVQQSRGVTDSLQQKVRQQEKQQEQVETFMREKLHELEASKKEAREQVRALEQRAALLEHTLATEQRERANEILQVQRQLANAQVRAQQGRANSKGREELATNVEMLQKKIVEQEQAIKEREQTATQHIRQLQSELKGKIQELEREKETSEVIHQKRECNSMLAELATVDLRYAQPE